MNCPGPTDAAKQLEATAPPRGTSAPLSLLGGDSVCVPAETQEGPIWGNTSTSPAEPGHTTSSGLRTPRAPLATYPCCRRAAQETLGSRLLKLIINLLNGHLDGDGTFTRILGSYLPPVLSQTPSCLLPLSLRALKKRLATYPKVKFVGPGNH